ncbi:MAG: GreA/GreB family elongation factor, partial [Verrucomicrobia bacterium]|nr:GreA/GreB family elongation factor [Verrucomicrobiota bacterium]
MPAATELDEVTTMEETQDLDPKLQAKLDQLAPGSYCRHRSWGVGKITSKDDAIGSFTIDFRSKKGHPMEFAYAAESLKPLGDDHLEARVLREPDAVRKLSSDNPGDFMILAVTSLGREATGARLEEALVPHLFKADGWKKFWEAAKRAMRKDPRFVIPGKRVEAIQYLESAPDAKAGGLENLQEAVGAKRVIEALEKLQKGRNAGELKSLSEEAFKLIEAAALKIPKSQMSQVAELALARSEFAAAAGLPAEPGIILRGILPVEPNRLAIVIEALPAGKQPRFTELAANQMGERWAELFFALLPRASGRLMDAITARFKKANRLGELEGALDRLLRERLTHPDLIVWLCRNRTGELSKMTGPSLFMTALNVLEKEQLSDSSRGTRLRDLLLEDKDLVRDLLAPASPEEVRDVTRAALASTAFEELDKRSLIGALVKLYPEVGNMVAGENRAMAVEAPIVSWESLEKRKAELEEITLKKIPANSKEIGVARSYGDLKENHEFKAAKEMQSVLMRRKSDLEAMIVSAQGTDFSGVKTGEVGIGTVVEYALADGAEKKTISILGAWDSDPDNGIISYQTAVAQALMNRKAGDTAELPGESGARIKVIIQSIRAYRS